MNVSTELINPNLSGLSASDMSRIHSAIKADRAQTARSSTETRPEDFKPRHRNERRSIGRWTLDLLKATGRGIARLAGVEAARERDQAEIIAIAAVYKLRIDTYLPLKTDAADKAFRFVPLQRPETDSPTWQSGFDPADLDELATRFDAAQREDALANTGRPTGEYELVGAGR